MQMPSVFLKKYTILKNFEKSLIPSLLPHFKLSTSKIPRSALFEFGTFVLFFIASFVYAPKLSAQELSPSIYPYFVSGPSAEQALPLQLIDIHFKNAASLSRSYVYLRDAEISGANDLIIGAADSWVIYSILNPNETELMGNIPANIDQLNKWGTATSQVSLKMAANQTADGKSILLKKLSIQDAEKQVDGSYKIRIIALAMEGNDINRFGIYVTEQPTKSIISPNATISTPFLNILDNTALGNTFWSVKNPTVRAARVSIFVAKTDGNSASLSAFVEARTSPKALWGKVELADAGNRLIGAIGIDEGKTHYFRTQAKANSQDGVRLYIAQNAKLLDLYDFTLGMNAGSEPSPIARASESGTDTAVAAENLTKNTNKPTNTDATFRLEVKASSSNCSTFNIGLVANNSADLAKLRQISWSNTGLINSSKTQATYSTLSKDKTTGVVVDLQYLENNELKKLRLSEEIAQNIPPKADGGINRSAEINEYVTFDGTLSEDQDGQIREYFWDLGDGTTKNGARIEHRYQQTGSYQVVLTVVDNVGGPCGINTDTLEVSINKEPVIVLSPDVPSKIGANQYNVGQSYDEDGQITDITWYLNDKVVGKSPFIEISLKATDSPLKVVITDNSFAGNQSSERLIYTQTIDKPTAIAGKDQVVEAEETVVLQADATAASTAFPIVAYEWKIGQEVFTDKRLSRKFPTPGSYTAILTVRDSRGFTDEDELSIFVNSQPTARFSITEISGKEVKLSAASSFDADKQQLTYNWTLGTEKKASGSEVVYTFAKEGNHTISLSVNDGSGAPNAINTYAQTISLGTASAISEPLDSNLAQLVDETTAQNIPTKIVLKEEEETKPRAPAAKQPFDQAKIEGPASVFVGQKATFTLKTMKKPSAIFWDNGEGISGNGDEVSIEFREAGIRQITAIFFEKTPTGTNEQYLTTEVEIIDRRKEDSKVEAVVAHNRSLIAGRYVQLMLNAGDKAGQVFKRKDERFRKVLYQTQNEESEDGSKNWKRFTGYCENQTYDLLSFFGLGEELVGQDRLYVFVNGKLISASSYKNEAINLAAIIAYEIRIYYPESVLQGTQDLQFKHLIKSDAAPEISASVPSMVELDQWKTYSAANSFDADGQILRYYWEMGDGLRYEGKTIRHQYVHAGVYEVKLIIESGKGLSECERVEKRWTVEVE